jgi:Membrane domain of glycerophosphoryl diester phosphodiesterase
MATRRDAYTWFSVGGVLTDSFEVLGHNLGTFFTISLMAEIPNILFVLLSAVTHSFATGLHIPFWASILFGIFILLVKTLVVLAFSCVAQAALVIATISYLNGKRLALRVCLAESYRSIAPVIAVTMLAALGIGCGFLLLVVPGIILMLGWIVAVPVCVLERKAALDAFRRSWELTKTHRWAILGALAIVVVSGWFLLIITISVSGAIGSASPEAALPTLSIMLLIPQTIIFALVSAMVGVIYYEIFFIKEGRAPDVQASVAD